MSIASDLNKRAFGYLIYSGKDIITSGIIYDGRKSEKTITREMAEKYPGKGCIVQKATVRYYMSHSSKELASLIPNS